MVAFERVVDGQVLEASEVYVSAWPSFADAREAGLVPSSDGLRLFVAAPVQPQFENIDGVAVPLRSGYAINLYEVKRRQ
jgi:hypothetical protein